MVCQQLALQSRRAEWGGVARFASLIANVHLCFFLMRGYPSAPGFSIGFSSETRPSDPLHKVTFPPWDDHRGRFFKAGGEPVMAPAPIG